ncbi:NIPSNAP family protein [Paraglaciecola sp.]|uniref:NIPSNAP family protein n=1 Tax=Paraglaciecola sp. TaxID=1920173 RepID=UPI0030F3C1F3
MVTCYLKYVIDQYKLEEFEKYAKLWIPLVNKFGGIHNGYFLPSEGANNIALALFTFPSLAEYECYRNDSFTDADCIAAFKYAEETKCILSYERSFFKPVFE